MKTLDLTREQAIELMQDDDQIDKGVKLFEQTEEQKKASKKYTKVAKSVNAYGKATTRTIKSDDDKVYLMNIIAESLSQLEINHEIVKQGQEMLLYHNNRKFKIVLSAPRK